MKLNKENFLKLINQKFIFENNPTIAVAVSGGPDSMALLFLLNRWIKFKKGKLIALIVNHNLRKSSMKEALSISKLLSNKNIRSKILTINKQKIIKKSMEEARLFRYEKLINFCKKNYILHLFVGHHKDDNLETFVNRKISGSDFDGLKSMKNLIVLNNICLYRPLLGFSKKQILNFNSCNKIKYITDPTNENLNYTRPVIRNFIKNSNSKIYKEILHDFIDVKKNINLYNQMIYEIFFENLEHVDTRKIKINHSKFELLNKLVSTKIIKLIYKFFFSQKVFLRTSKIQNFLSKITEDNFNFFNLKGMDVKKQGNSLIFSKNRN